MKRNSGSVNVLGLVGVLALVLILPVTVFLLGQNQDPSSQASSEITLPSSSAPAGYIVEDAFVDSDTPTKNYGGAPVLWADGLSTKTTYLKLNLTSLAGKQINSAVLKLFVTSGTDQVVLVKVVPVSTWTGDTITYSVRPLPGATLATINGGQVGETAEVDLTEFVQQNAGQVVSLAIETEDPIGLSFNSLESPFDKVELLVDSN